MREIPQDNRTLPAEPLPLWAPQTPPAEPPPQAPSIHQSQTSREAAAAAVEHQGHLAGRILRFIRNAGAEGATDPEIQQALEISGDSQRPCRRRLEQELWILDSGRTRRTTSGRRAIVWIANEQGGP